MLYTNATIITVNAKREILLNGAILVQGSRIADIGKTDAFLSKYKDQETYDLTGHIVMPGLISTHMHTAQTLLRGNP
jgi:cytosine/adenosine deaminase-related metal-dependent hydrolase